MGNVPNTVFERLLEWVGENNSAAVMTEIDTLLNAGNSPSQLARQMVRYIRNALMSKLGGESSELLQISDDERARVARTAMLFAEEDLTRFLQIMLRSFDEMNYRQEPRFHLELGLLKLVHTQRLIPLEQLMSQLPGRGRSDCAAFLRAARAAASSGAALPPSPSRPSAPRSVASNEAARGGSVASSAPPQRHSPPSHRSNRTPAASLAGSSGLTGSALAPTGSIVMTLARLFRWRQALPSRWTSRPRPRCEESPIRPARTARSADSRPCLSPKRSALRPISKKRSPPTISPSRPPPANFVSLTDKLRDAVAQALHDKGPRNRQHPAPRRALAGQ